MCARQLKSVRRQFNEYGTMRRTLLGMTITIASYVAVLFLVGGDEVLQRRITIFCELCLPSLRHELVAILLSE